MGQKIRDVGNEREGEPLGFSEPDLNARRIPSLGQKSVKAGSSGQGGCAGLGCGGHTQEPAWRTDVCR